MVVAFTLGREPATANEYFTLLQDDRVIGLMRSDFTSLINVLLFSVTSFAAYVVMRNDNDVIPGFGMALVLLGIAFSVSAHSAFSMLYLSNQYVTATAVQQTQLLAAGEAVIASNWWNSTSGVMAGIFLQGGTVLVSFAMLRSKHFSNATAYAGQGDCIKISPPLYMARNLYEPVYAAV